MNAIEKIWQSVVKRFSTRNWKYVVLIGLSLAISLLFLFSAWRNATTGFPLDDAWIHQTYARNLADSGRWEFVQGQLSGGSTSPLWTLLISVGYLAGIENPFIWTTILSVAVYIGLVLSTYWILESGTQGNQGFAFFGSLIALLEWHLLWSVGSGMESLLFCLILLLGFGCLKKDKGWWWSGLLCGLAIWARPDGITLLGPIGLIAISKIIAKKLNGKDIVRLLIPFVLIAGGYCWFTWSITGNILPNTFFAKQLEYASQLALPLWTRILKIIVVPVAGTGALLIPGFIAATVIAFKQKNIWRISLLLWWLGYAILYAIRLPMTYQHGRYMFPLIPLFLVIGLMGTFELSNVPSRVGRYLAKRQRLMGFAAICVALVFTVSGNKAFAEDVRTIDRLMVQPALWISENTAENSLIAAHDIGAMGFFSNRKILDLAGLVQPEIIPIIRDEEAIKKYLQEQSADYLVVFTDWYVHLGNLGKDVIHFDFVFQGQHESIVIRDLRQIIQ